MKHKLDTMRGAGTALGSLFLCAGVFAQDAQDPGDPKRLISIEPRVGLTYTMTDNARLSSTAKESDQVMQVSPGVRVNVQGSRVKAFVDYSLSGAAHSLSSIPSSTQNALTSIANVEAIDNFAFIDFNGSIAQQAISAFGQQSAGSTSANANSTEVSTYRLSPYLSGRLGDIANYEARISRAVTSSKSAVASNVNTSDSLLRVAGGSGYRKLGWSADASQQTVAYSAGRQTENDRYNLGLSYGLTPQFSVNASAGRESNNFATLAKETYDTNSAGFTWTPSEATKVSASQGQRSFGQGHNVSVEHRTGRTVWRFTDSKDVTSTPSQAGQFGVGNLYDLLFAQFASAIPNPVARAQAVNDFLQTYGLSANAPVTSGFLSSTVAVQRRQELSFALLGVRSSVTFIASQSESNRIDAISTALDDFNQSSVIRQQGLSINLAHRLTPDYSTGLSLSQQQTSGVTSSQDTTLRSVVFNLTGKVSKKSTASLSVRRVQSDNSLVPYIENAVIANVNMAF